MSEIEEFFNEFNQDLLAAIGSEGGFTKGRFVDQMCSKFVDQGLIPDYQQTNDKPGRGMDLDAWCHNEELGQLTLYICDYRSSGQLESLSQKQMETHYKRLTNLLEACHKDAFLKKLEESSDVTTFVLHIRERYEDIKSVNLVLLSNARLSGRVDQLPGVGVDGLNVKLDLWDIGRLHRNYLEGREIEDLEIDLKPYEENGLKCLAAHARGDQIKSYLLAMPGNLIADLYEQYGERLLEQNVRTFLQFRGKVNKGIRNTLVNEPEMFFSYNNGISATAEEVKVNRDGNLTYLKNFQVVNGGQTTASIFTSREKEKADLSNVFVQVKLSVIPQAKIEDVVPRISEYANTQNKVNAADFFSNHPFHKVMEEFSRRIWASASDGSVHETKWFYERARGQYANQQANMTPGEKKKFLIQNPKRQMFTKTDLAKFILTFDQYPYEVSLGAQKAFAGASESQLHKFPGLVGRIRNGWEKNEKQYNELWFKQAIGKAILFRGTDRLVYGAPWYKAYKANVVTYTLAKLALIAGERGGELDYMKIWELQQIPVMMEGHILKIAEVVDKVLHKTPAGTSNVSEYAKKVDCWDAVKKAPVSGLKSLDEFLVNAETVKEQEKDAEDTQVIMKGIQAQTYVVEKDATYWRKLRDWNQIHKKLTGKEIRFLDLACRMPNVIPEAFQCEELIKAENRAKVDGFYVKTS